MCTNDKIIKYLIEVYGYASKTASEFVKTGSTEKLKYEAEIYYQYED